jgi:transposase
MRVMRRAVERGQQRKEQSVVKYLAVDEKAFRRGHSYLTIVCNASEGTVEWVTEDRDRQSLASYYQQLSEEQLKGIEAVAMDMWPAYISATVGELPGASDKIVFDRFHVMKMMNKALDKVRRQEAERLRRRGDPRLKKTRHLWLFGYENLPEERVEDFEVLRESELHTARAWHIKETLRYLWDYRRIGWARKFFRQWYAWAIRSRLEPIRKVAKSLKAHAHNILTYCKHRITTGVAEGINSKIMSIKRLAGGFRNMENFKTAIYFYCGGLDLHPR